MVDKITVEVPGGGSELVLRILRRYSKNAEVEANKQGKDVLRIDSDIPREALLKIRLAYPEAKITPDFKEDTGEWLEAIIQCPNKNCVTSQPKEPARPRFRIVRANPPTLQCYYCGRYIDHEAAVSQLRA